MRFTLAIMALVAIATVASAQSTFMCASNTQEPIVPTYEIGLSGTDLSLNVTFNRNATSDEGYDQVVVSFGGDLTCDLNVLYGTADDSGDSTYWTMTENTTNCQVTYEFIAPINHVLGNCGYTQDNAREAGRTHFLNTIRILTVQTRDDLRNAYNATREFPFTSDISIATNTTATVTGLQVFGTAYTLNLLGNLKVAVTDNFANDPNTPYLYTVSGTVVTSVQWPYRLELSADSAHAHFDSQDFTAVANTYCDAEADNNTACTQEWDFSFDILPSVACVEETGITALTDEWIWMQFTVNCSSQFTGECAPDFAVDPAMNLTLTSADFCPKFSTISLQTDSATYAFQPSDQDNTAVPADSTEEWLTEVHSTHSAPFVQSIYTSYVEETIFTYESTLYGEVRVRVADGGATLATTNITQIRTVPVDNTYLTRIVYDADATGETVESYTDASVAVANAGFGGTTGYTNNRARFQFQLNNNTFDRNNEATVDADAAEGGSIEVDLVVSFAEGASAVNDEWSSALLLQEFVVDNNGKSVPIKAATIVKSDAALFEEDSSMTASTAFQLGGSIATPTVTIQNVSAASNALTIGAVAVAGVAIIALVAVVVLRRPEAAKPSSNLNTLPQSSSFSTVPAQIQMETTASAYNQV